MSHGPVKHREHGMESFLLHLQAGRETVIEVWLPAILLYLRPPFL
jgi:hypothetical protein